MNIAYDVHGNQFIPESELAGLSDLLPNRLLIWHDEFKGNKIDPSKWRNLFGQGSTSTWLTYAEDLAKVTQVSGGLKYRCLKDFPKPSVGAKYSSTYIMTQGLFEFRYGRIEAKIKFPNVTPHHTTFWTLGAPVERKSVSQFEMWETTEGVLFPSCGEIDIAEYDDGAVGARTHWSNGGFDTSATYQTGGNIATLTTTPNDWHIYACEWTESAITFYVDGVQKGTWDTSNGAVSGWNPFQIPHFLILNCVVSLAGEQSWDMAQTEVAWVRVYAPSGVTAPVAETAISIDSAKSVSVGGRVYLSPTFTPANPTDMTLNWKSHNEDIVTCYGGLLVGKSAGTTYVQCTTKNGLTALCKVTVS